MGYNGSMPQFTQSTDLMSLLTSSWPTGPRSLKSHCAQAATMLRSTPTHPSAVVEALGQLSHESWWQLWVTDRAFYEDDPVHPALVADFARRRAHLHAHPDIAAAVAASGCVIDASYLILQATTHPPCVWVDPSTKPAELVDFVRHMHTGPHVHTDDAHELAVDLWSSLLKTRLSADTPELKAATEKMWAILNASEDHADHAAELIVLMGHDPVQIKDFMRDIPPGLSAAIMHTVATQPQPKPVDLDLLAHFATSCTSAQLAQALTHVLSKDHDPTWTAAVVDLLWDKADLNGTKDNEPEHDNSPCPYVKNLLLLAHKGMTSEVIKRMEHPTAITPTKMATMIRVLPLSSKPTMPTVFRSIMEYLAPSSRANAMRVFANPDASRHPSSRYAPTVTEAIIASWPLLPPEDAAAVFAENKRISAIPEIAAHMQHQVLTQATNANSMPARRAPRM